MAERILNGYQVDFAKICPFLKDNPPSRKIGFFFNAGDKDVIASETSCTNGGLPGVEKRSESDFLIPINPDHIVAYCNGCNKFPNGFEEEIE